MNRDYCVFDKLTGIILARLNVPAEQLSANIPEGCAAIEGAHDLASNRVDISTGRIVAYQPESPGSDYEWIADSGRWELSPDVLMARARRSSAKAQIVNKENALARAMRELALNPGDVSARQRISDIDQEIASLRVQARGD